MYGCHMAQKDHSHSFLSKNKKGVRGSMEMIMVCNYLFLGRVGRESVKDNNQAKEIEIDSFKLMTVLD